jgi:hypothetical protein
MSIVAINHPGVTTSNITWAETVEDGRRNRCHWEKGALMQKNFVAMLKDGQVDSRWRIAGAQLC